MNDDEQPQTETIEIIAPAVRRKTVDGDVIGQGESGQVRAGVAETLVHRRRDARWSGDNRCVADTNDGDRCTRKAGEGGYCYQHRADAS